MVIKRGEIWWADLGEPKGSEPGYRRPIVVISSDSFNRSKINTVICAILTSNLSYSDLPGNIFLSKKSSNLKKESVINISQILTLNKDELIDKVSKLSDRYLLKINSSLEFVLGIH